MINHSLMQAFVLCCLMLYHSKAQSQSVPISNIRTPESETENRFYKIGGPCAMNHDGVLTCLRQIGAPAGTNYIQLGTTADRTGQVHYRCRQTYNGVPLRDAIFIVHTVNDTITAINGRIAGSIVPANDIIFDRTAARERALAFVAGTLYLWEIPDEERWLKLTTANKNASWFPEGSTELISDTADGKLHYAWMFDIFAAKPLNRQQVYVDAENGEILFSYNRIATLGDTGTAITKYSGSRIIHTARDTNNKFILLDLTRANGIQTYNLHNTTSFSSATPFYDDDNLWNNYNTLQDEAATDAHWGAAMTYDYFFTQHGRNSLDNIGGAIYSYVHFASNCSNAFWDGTRVVYGDGAPPLTAYTPLDICGHELTHGVETHTADFDYYGEAGALAEGFSDLFGTAVEFYAKGAQHNANWTMGDEVGIVIRNLAKPKSLGFPDTYKGQYWDPAQQMHKNSTVLSHWFYMLCEGDTGVNDKNQSYVVCGIGMEKAAAIAYRTLNCYLINTSGYSDVCYYSILAANELYGPCSNESRQTTNAWYAAGVGQAYTGNVLAAFDATQSVFCGAPAIVHFSNSSVNASSFTWDFGDGTGSQTINPIHNYLQTGNYTVTLIAHGASCGSDTLTMNRYISIDASNSSEAMLGQQGQSETLSCCSGTLYDSGGQDNYMDFTNSFVTIAPPGAASLILTFEMFDFSDTNDVLFIYDGPTTASPVIGSFTGTSLSGATIQSGGGTVTLRQRTDASGNSPGFKMQWQCQQSGLSENPDQIQNTTIFPNPAHDVINVTYNTAKVGNADLSLYDITGRLIQHITGYSANSANTVVLDISALQPGVYLIEITTALKKVVRKFSKI